MSKYKVGDKVLLEGEIVEMNNNHHFPYKVKFINDAEEIFSENELSIISKTYSDGLADAWELARKVNAMSEDEFDKCFNFDWQCTTDFTYQEVLAMVEAYEKEKEIKVGDVVTCFNDYKGVVLDCDDEQELVDVFSENGCVDGLVFSDVKKTGRHIDISSILEQIRGNE